MGVSLGLAYKRGRLTRDPAIRVHIKKKHGLSMLKWNQAFPKRVKGVRIDVVQSEYQSHSELPAAWPMRILRNPMAGGVAIARNGQVSYGTLSALAVDSVGVQYVLTAQHVAGNASTVIVQAVGGSRIGVVHLAELNPSMDAALIRLTSSRKIDPGVTDFGNYHQSPLVTRPGTVDAQSLPLAVNVIGASSGKTTGFIDAVSASLDVDYPGGQSISFIDQLHLVGNGAEISRQGDSGALVLERGTNRVIALLFAGEKTGEDFALATPIHRILDKFKVNFA